MTDPIRVLIIEDNRQYTESLNFMIQLSDRMEWVASYSSAEAYLESPREKADIVLLDLQLPGKSGLQLVPVIRKEIPDSHILVLTQQNDYHTTLEAIRLGVSGYLLKDAPIASIREAIIEVHEGGGRVIDPQLSRIVLNALSGDSDAEADPLLTSREKQVLELMAVGYVKKEVAGLMKVSYSAVAQYTESIYKKLQVPNVAAAVATAIRKGLI
jgi:DNA-binding NarL/FixJ family response regulator